MENSVPCVVKALPETSISEYWLSEEINKSTTNLMEIGLPVRAVVSDGHASNNSAFSTSLNKNGGDHKLFIYHPAYDGQLKTYLFFDTAHLTKNIRNNLLNRTKFVFPEYHLDLFEDATEVPAGYISWKMFYDICELDEKLQGNLHKAPKLTYKATHPGNNKQDVSLALAIFDETISAVIKSCYPNRLDAANVLNLFHKVFVTCNSKQVSNVPKTHNKPAFLFCCQLG